MKPSLLQPDLINLLNEYSESLKVSFNCIQIGQIIKFYSEDKTADVNICFKQKINNEIKDYSLLLKCPVVGNKITVPVEVGESVLILFNDRNLDSWFETGTAQVPYTQDKHNISDGIVICGLNNLTNKITYDNENINLTFNSNLKLGENISNTTNNDFVVNANNINLNAGAGLIQIANTAQSLFTILNTLLITLLSLKTGATPATPTFVIDTASVEALTTIQQQLAQLLKV